MTHRSVLCIFLLAAFSQPTPSFAFGKKPETLPSPTAPSQPAPKPIATKPAPSPLPPSVPTNPGQADEEIVGADYRARYSLANATQKLIDNQGNGFDALYGLRNMRSVLNGVYYRGGANNTYNRNKKRSNANPLPEEGLQHLCEEGFTRSVYLYETNFSTASKRVRCRTFDGHENTLDYLQISGLSNGWENTARLHALIFEHVRNPRLGPIYDHCWNGWHASGYVAATALRQFCGFTADQAVRYWDANTDGNNKDKGYESIRQKIRAFVPDAQMQLTAAEKASLCPAPGDLAFSPR